jgi:pimeloyl-ACP methyl ester carboxylesterase
MWSTGGMEHATSADGTPIAFDRIGSGHPVLIVGGAFSTADAGRPLAGALAEAGFQGVPIDRRGRGGSGDTPPYAPEREAEDLAAVIEVVGGRAAVLGHSSGAILSLFAAAQGVPVTHLFLSEPPFRFEVEHAADLVQRLQAFIDAGHPEEVVTTFQREAVGLPEPVLEQIRSSPMFPSLVAVAQSVVYDETLAEALSTPTDAMTRVDVPVTILRGEPTFPFLVAAAERLATLIPSAELVVVPESQNHAVDPAGTTREVAARLR